jgi:hypothetical protein
VAADPEQRLRELCLSLPEVTERLNHGEPAWLVRSRALVTFSARKPEGRVGFWCPAPPGELAALVAMDPDRFFQPPFGGRGWIGVYLDVPVDWTEVREIVLEAYRLVAPKVLVRELGDAGNSSDHRRYQPQTGDRKAR